MREAGPGYRAAVEGVALREEPDRGVLLVSGRAPVQMLDGILTAKVPGPETPVEPAVRSGRAEYSVLLTPKGRMVSDLRVLRIDVLREGDAAGRPSGSGGTGAAMMRGPAVAPGKGSGDEKVLLDVPRAGLAGVLEHFRRFLPPRFATVEDVSDAWRTLTVMGPGAAGLLSLHALGLRVDEETLGTLAEGAYRSIDTGAGSRLRVVRGGDAPVPVFDLLADPPTVEALRRTLTNAGAVEVGEEERRVLRVEAGRPAFGVDMDEETIPMEAGLGERAIDHGKGCYTGQEVVVRIRDRGHVNRTLRGLRLPDGDLPEPGATLYAPDVRGERAAGALTSVVRSPRMGPVGLGYVRREVEVPGRVRVGALDGPEAEVVALDGDWGP